MVEIPMDNCIQCDEPLLPEGCALVKVMDYAELLGLKYTCIGDSCSEYHLEVWDPTQICEKD